MVVLTSGEKKRLHQIYETDNNEDRKKQLEQAIAHINMFEYQVYRVRAILENKEMPHRLLITKLFCYTNILFHPLSSFNKS